MQAPRRALRCGPRAREVNPAAEPASGDLRWPLRRRFRRVEQFGQKRRAPMRRDEGVVGAFEDWNAAIRSSLSRYFSFVTAVNSPSPGTSYIMCRPKL